MKKILVLGSLGMAGHIMYGYLKANLKYEVIGVARSAGEQVDKVLNVTDFDALELYIQDTQPDVVVNCIGVLVSGSKNNLCNAILINSYLPNKLATLSAELKFKLVHISTDCVFSGKQGGYTENSFRDGDDNYARTKALGEVIDEHNLTIRTSIIGPELKANGTGLMHWFFNQQDAVSGYSQAFWSGVTTLELAKATMKFLESEICGLVQLCPKGKISKYNLLCEINDIWRRAITISPNADYHVDKSLICTRSDIHYEVHGFHEMLLEMKSWTDVHSHYYSHYQL